MKRFRFIVTNLSSLASDGENVFSACRLRVLTNRNLLNPYRIENQFGLRLALNHCSFINYHEQQVSAQVLRAPHSSVFLVGYLDSRISHSHV